MQEHAKKPAIRFKGFTDDWEQRKLGEIGNIITGSTPNTNIRDNYGGNFLFVSPVDIQGNRYVNTTITTLTKKGFKQCRKVKAKSSLFVSIGSTIGKVAQSEKELTTNQQINSLEPYESYDEDYIYTALENIADKVKAIASTQAVPIVNKTTFSEIEIHITNQVEEQKKIGFWFARLDRLITLHQRKHDKLVNIKKAMLEKMFPQDGAKIPEIRFKGFTDDWEQRKLGELVLIERGGSPRPIDDYITKSDDGLNWVKIGDAPAQGRYITKTAEKIKPEGLSKTRQVIPGDLILSNSMSFGKPYIMAIEGCIHDGWLLLRDQNNEFDLKFLCHMLGTNQMILQYKKFASGSTVNNLNKELVGNASVVLPYKNEQKLIGEYIETLDRLITLHQRKLEKLQNIKRACLEKLFV